MKTAVVVLLFVAAASACAPDDAHDLTDGCIPAVDPTTLLTSETITAQGKLWQVVTKTWDYPHTGAIKGPITCIKVRDLMPDNTGGCSYEKMGGVNTNAVTLEFVSQRSKAMKFRVEVYGTR